MLQRKSHNRYTKMMLNKMGYDAPMYIIDSINGAIDNPSKDDIMLQRLTGLTGSQYMGRNKAGHRQINHDPFKSSFIGYQKYGKIGALIANLHTQLDMASDEAVHSFGSSGRDLLEAMFNLSYEKNNPRYRKHF